MKHMQSRMDKKRVPTRSIPLMWNIYRKVLPSVDHHLAYWRKKAEQIPNEELRTQAIASLTTKKFHCQGGGVYALLARPGIEDTVIQFIVAYQTISDYLDNLCDRSVSQDGNNFRQLHQSMVDAIAGTSPEQNYYDLQDDQDDGGYLRELVLACHDAMNKLPNYELFQAPMLTLCRLYCDLQVYKHISWEHREHALSDWWQEHKDSFSELSWYEFAAATGSTLGIFYYVSLASLDYPEDYLEQKVLQAYFPYVQGLHIMLDYLIDQEEDRVEGDLNFCFYYDSELEKAHRLEWFVQRAKAEAQQLPDPNFHCMIIEGLLGMYLSQDKVHTQPEVKQLAKKLVQKNKLSTRFFYLNAWYVHLKGKRRGEK